MRRLAHIFAFTALLMLSSCGDSDRPTPSIPTTPVKPAFTLVETPVFNTDSAYAFVARQVAFGPRVPGTAEHRACAKWLAHTLERFGLEVNTQEATVTAYNGDKLPIFNIMGRLNPEATERVLLCAHWDSRPYADRDDHDRFKPIDGANDGASGVGVLLELMRAIQADSLQPAIGVDVVFFDAEDYGKPEEAMIGKSADSWCLGSQYWCRNMPIPNYQARYGILLDMVGAGNAIFPKEGFSEYYAPLIVKQVWDIARKMNYRDYFVEYPGGQITDDHLYINRILKIPTIDIIHYEPGRNDFGTFHHRHTDNMDGIAAGTLGVVGNVVMQVLYQEK